MGVVPATKSMANTGRGGFRMRQFRVLAKKPQREVGEPKEPAVADRTQMSSEDAKAIKQKQIDVLL